MLIPTLKYLLGICRVEQHFNIESSISHMNFEMFQRSVNKILHEYILFLLKFLTSQELLIS